VKEPVGLRRDADRDERPRLDDDPPRRQEGDVRRVVVGERRLVEGALRRELVDQPPADGRELHVEAVAHAEAQGVADHVARRPAVEHERLARSAHELGVPVGLQVAGGLGGIDARIGVQPGAAVDQVGVVVALRELADAGDVAGHQPVVVAEHHDVAPAAVRQRVVPVLRHGYERRRAHVPDAVVAEPGQMARDVVGGVVVGDDDLPVGVVLAAHRLDRVAQELESVAGRQEDRYEGCHRASIL
jgi:hypothetical protein